jgi:thermitase
MARKPKKNKSAVKKKKAVSDQIRPKNRCRLPKFAVKSIASLEEAKQEVGWQITAFDLPNEWAVTQGEGVKIAVLDSGADLQHPDISDNLLPGINLVRRNNPPQDDNKHGTHVTGIICAQNNEIGMVGVAPKAKVIPVKVLDGRGNGDMNLVAEGVRWAADNGADIISMSLGSPSPQQQLRRAIQYAAAKGIPTFCAAGNAGNTENLFYPANYPETISIGSIDLSLDRSSFSNTGQNLDFMAPGRDIFSTIPPKWYATLSGTSMACPFAVGVAALVLSYVRNNKVRIKLDSVDDYRRIFRENCTPISNAKFAGKKFFTGLGIIDPRKLLQWYKQQSNPIKLD